MLLMNAEYILNGDFLGDLDFWPSFIMRHINLILVADAGLVRTSLRKDLAVLRIWRDQVE